MASGWPARPRARGRARADATAAEDERHERIVAQHPGYQAAIDLGEDLAGDVNPRAHIVTHEAIEEQLAANDPPEARAAYDRLAALGYAAHDIVHALADVLVREIWQVQTDHSEFDRTRYAARLAALPQQPLGIEGIYMGVMPYDVHVERIFAELKPAVREYVEKRTWPVTTPSARAKIVMSTVMVALLLGIEPAARALPVGPAASIPKGPTGTPLMR